MRVVQEVSDVAFRPRVAIGRAEESESYSSGSRRNGVYFIYQAFPIGKIMNFSVQLLTLES
jgi:hypothetical protein